MSELNVIGLTLDEAREVLTGIGTVEVVTVETHASPSRASRPVWGQWRVLRARTLDNATVELLIARELLRDERVGN